MSVQRQTKHFHDNRSKIHDWAHSFPDKVAHFLLAEMTEHTNNGYQGIKLGVVFKKEGVALQPKVKTSVY